MGDPDRGFDDRQPGGWIFNILDYAEEPALRAAGAGELQEQLKAEQVRRRLATPLPLFVCSSRRPAAVWPFVVGKLHLTGDRYCFGGGVVIVTVMSRAPSIGTDWRPTTSAAVALRRRSSDPGAWTPRWSR